MMIQQNLVKAQNLGTRSERPGVDLSKQPPVVRLNKELDHILTLKLKGEDLNRESGTPYMIVRPYALTEEPTGVDLLFDQGDNIMGKISREEVARMCVGSLESPYACDKIFEVKGVIPFSQPCTVDPKKSSSGKGPFSNILVSRSVVGEKLKDVLPS